MDNLALYRRLLPGGQVLDGSSSKADALRVQVAAALFERVPAEPITSPDTETWCERVEALLRDLHEERPTQNALATFLLNGLLAGPALDVPRALGAALHCATLCVVYGEAHPRARGILGVPALWCGVDFLRGCCNEKLVILGSILEFTTPLMRQWSLLAQTGHEAGVHRSDPVWYCSVLGAMVALEGCVPDPQVQTSAPKAAFRAYQIALEVLDDGTDNEEPRVADMEFLLATDRLFQIPLDLMKQAKLGEQPADALWAVGEGGVTMMMCYGTALTKLSKCCFRREALNPELPQRQLFEVLQELLESLLLLLESGAHAADCLDANVFEALSQAVEGYRHHDLFNEPASSPMHSCVQLAAECMLAMMEGPIPQDMAQEFWRQLCLGPVMDAVDGLPLAKVWESSKSSGSPVLWTLLCTCLRVLGCAATMSFQARVDVLREDGVQSLIRAARWDDNDPQATGPAGGLTEAQDRLTAAVMARVVARNALVCASCLRSVVSGDLQEGVLTLGECLADMSSLGELECLLERWEGAASLAPAAQQAQRELQEALIDPKLVADVDLDVAALVCAAALLGQSEAACEELMGGSPLLTHLLEAAAWSTPTGGTRCAARAVALSQLADLMRERAAWRKQLVTARVHCVAAAAAVEALNLLRDSSAAAKKARLAKLHASRKRGARRRGGCGCGAPDCPYRFYDAAQNGGEDESEAAALAARTAEAAKLLNAAMCVLLTVQEAGKEGRRPCLEALQDGQLQAAAASTPPGLVPNEYKEAEANLKSFLAWGEQQAKQGGGGKGPAAMDAEKAAEVAAAALLAEEEAAAKRAAAKAAKRQRQKAAKQATKQAEQPQQEEGAAGPPEDGPTPEPSPAPRQEPGSPGPSGVVANGGAFSLLGEVGDAAEPRPPSQQQQPEQPGGSSQRAGKGKKAKGKQRQQQQQQQAVSSRAAVQHAPAAPAQPAVLPALAAILDVAGASSGGSAAASGSATPMPPDPGARALASGIPTAMPRQPPGVLPAQPAARPAAPPGFAAAPSAATAAAHRSPPQDEQEAEFNALLSQLLPGILSPAPPAAPPSQPGAAAASSAAALQPPGAFGFGSVAGPSGTAAAAAVPMQGAAAAALQPALAAVLLCPLTRQLFADPVIAGDGHTYERSAIEAWVRAGNRHSPITGLPLGSGGLRPNHAVRQLLEGDA